ncbi:serine hydrolase domain-containing protein [Amycolatopsis pigmentata]|uniref:Serine hydrolase domain-containing protein n=1 Tax=Amycolatopsis pigmentata TaxID=450801 RepID=A0ABW5FZR6_9PSEU
MDFSDLREEVEQRARKYLVPGAQLVIDRPGETVSIAVGTAEYGTGREVTGESRFPVGSVTKAFTATLAMQLVADGELALDLPLTEYLPELTGSGHDNFAGVTLRRLLSHTAGIVCDHEQSVRGSRSLRGLAAACRELEPLHPPGRFFSYSNIGYGLIGCLIEKTSRENWWDLIEEFTLGPLGVDPAWVVDPRAGRPAPGIVSGHTVGSGRDEVRPVDVRIPAVWAPAGALALSAEDVVELARGHYRTSRHGLLGPSETAEMHNAVDGAEPFGFADGWGLGFALFDSGSSRWIGHEGTTGGSTCNLRVEPASDMAVVLTTNATSGQMLWDDIVPVLRERGLDVGSYSPRRPSSSIPAGSVDCLGEYRNGELFWTLTRQGAGLILTDETGARDEVALCDGLLLRADKGGVVGRLLRDGKTGEITYGQVEGRLFRRRHIVGKDR